MVLTKEDFQFIKENDSQYKSQVGQDIIVDHILNKKIKGFLLMLVLIMVFHLAILIFLRNIVIGEAFVLNL